MFWSLQAGCRDMVGKKFPFFTRSKAESVGAEEIRAEYPQTPTTTKKRDKSLLLLFQLQCSAAGHGVLLLSGERVRKPFLGWEDEVLWYRTHYMLVRNTPKWCKMDQFSEK